MTSSQRDFWGGWEAVLGVDPQNKQSNYSPFLSPAQNKSESSGSGKAANGATGESSSALSSWTGAGYQTVTATGLVLLYAQPPPLFGSSVVLLTSR